MKYANETIELSSYHKMTAAKIGQQRRKLIRYVHLIFSFCDNLFCSFLLQLFISLFCRTSHFKRLRFTFSHQNSHSCCLIIVKNVTNFFVRFDNNTSHLCIFRFLFKILNTLFLQLNFTHLFHRFIVKNINNMLSDIGKITKY